MEKHSCDEFFARSPQNLTVLAPFMVLKQSNFGENVQKTHRTSVFPLKSSLKLVIPLASLAPILASRPLISAYGLQSGLSGPGLRPGREM